MLNESISFNETGLLDSLSSSNSTLNLSYFSNIHITFVGSAIFFVILPFLVLRLRILPFETPHFALIGATLMIWSNVVSPKEFFNLISTQEYISGLLLILGTTIIGDYYSREQFFSKAIRHLLREDQAFSNYLLRISCISFVVSMMFSSDLSCLVLTPVMFKCWEEQERTENELETIVLAISSSAILGGSALPFGNVALSLFASQKLPLQINMKSCLQYFMVPSLICFWLNYAFLSGLYHIKHRRCCKYFHRPRCFRKKISTPSKETGLENFSNSSWTESALSDFSQYGHNSSQTNGSIVKDDKHFHPPTLETIIEDEVLVLPETPTLIRHDSRDLDLMASCMRPSMATEDLTTLDEEALTSSLSSGLTNSQLSNTRNSEAHLIGSHGQRQPMILNWESGQSVVGFTMVHLLNSNQGCHEVQGAHNTRQKLLRFTLVFVQLIVLTLQFVHSFLPHSFNPGLVSTGGAVVIMAMDALLNRRSLSSHFTSPGYKWGLPFVGFFSLLVIIYGFFKTGLPHYLWIAMGMNQADQGHFSSVFFLIIASLLVVNLIGAAPASLIFMFLLSSVDVSSPSYFNFFNSQNDLTNLNPSSSSSPSSSWNSYGMMLHLVWVISMSGMSSLTSSVSNSLVAQKSHEVLRARVTYFHHFAYGCPVSILFSVIGVVIISICLHLF